MAFVAYSVRDVPRARTFYQNVVGLEPGDSFGDHFVEFDVGNTTFAIDDEPPGIALSILKSTSFGNRIRQERM